MSTTAAVRRASRWQDSVRLLLLIDAAVKPVAEIETVPPTTVGVVHTQVRLQKLDFWVRYPDYLAFELMMESFILGSALDMVAPATMFDPGLLSADVPAFASAVAARDAAAAGECRPPADLAFEVGLASLIEGLRGVLRSLQPTG